MNPPLTPFLDLTTMNKVKGILVTVAGVTVLAVGIALVVLPGPAFLVIPAGLAILAIESAWAKRWLRSTKDLAKCSARFISGNHGNTNGGSTTEASSIVWHQLQSEEVVQFLDVDSPNHPGAKQSGTSQCCQHTSGKGITMNRSKYPNCGVKLGTSIYADACPQYHEKLKHNTKPLLPARKKDPQKEQSWVVRIFFRVVRFVES